MSEQLPPSTYGTRNPVVRFDDLVDAQDFILLSQERDPLGLGDRLRLVLGAIDEDGEHPQFLVATSDDAERLVGAGYQYGDASMPGLGHAEMGLEEPTLSL